MTSDCGVPVKDQATCLPNSQCGISRAYRLLGHVTAGIACVPSKIKIKDKNSNTCYQYLVCMNGGGQTPNVTIISYKRPSDLNLPGACYMPSSP